MNTLKVLATQEYPKIEISHIYLSKIEVLFKEGLEELMNDLNKFKRVIMTTTYPSEDFEHIYKEVEIMKSKKEQLIEVKIINNTEDKMDSRFRNNELINIIEFSNKVYKITGGKIGFGINGGGSFCGCKTLKKMNIPSSIIFIGEYSFCRCTTLKKITLPTSIKTIEEGCFSSCSSLTEILIPSTITDIKSYAYN